MIDLDNCDRFRTLLIFAPTYIPGEFCHISDAHHEKEDVEMEAFSYVTARHLE